MSWVAGERVEPGPLAARVGRPGRKLGSLVLRSAAMPRPGDRMPTRGESADPAPVGPPGAGASIRERAAFDFIRYGSVWEDADVLCPALEPVARGGRILSIASAGDNVLALLTLDPAEVVAVDVSAAQIACLELRIAAFRSLDDSELLGFLGTTSSRRRLAIYRELRPALSARSARFWDAHPGPLASGVIHSGKFERYLQAFRRYVLPLMHSTRTVGELCRPRSIEEQRAFYPRHWDGRRWRALFRIFFSRWAMGRLARDPAFFDHVEGPVSERILARTRRAMTELPVSSNPFLIYIMTGNYRPGAMPRYLRPEHTGVIRSRLDRIRTVEGTVERADHGRFDGFNLSDIFEYMGPAEHERCYAALLDRAKPGARLAYWNLMTPRSCPAAENHRVRQLTDLASSLHADDRAWFYQCFHVEEVLRHSP